MKRLTIEQVIDRAKSVHGDKYDYSKFILKGNKVKGTIICPIHGEFEQSMEVHCGGHGCPECAKEERNRKNSLTQEEFFERIKKVHGDKYDLSEVVYKNNKTKIRVICHEKDKNGIEHGAFMIQPGHFISGVGCSKCSGNNKRTIEDIITDAKKVHGDKYIYDKAELVNVNTPMKIICPIHGPFMQRPNDHLRGCGCPSCKADKVSGIRTLSFEEMIERADKIHNNKYKYVKESYINASTKMKIICPIHGEFEQLPSSHMMGIGCPKCRYSKLEKVIDNLLLSHDIEFIAQCNKSTFNWLNGISLDFYLPKYNIAIECQGIQHYEEVNFFGGKESLIQNQNRDKKKRELCEEHNIRLLYYADKQYEDSVITDENKLLEEIKKYGVR